MRRSLVQIAASACVLPRVRNHDNRYSLLLTKRFSSSIAWRTLGLRKAVSSASATSPFATASPCAPTLLSPPRAVDVEARQRHAQWRRRSLHSSRRRFLKHVTTQSRVVFPVPSVMDAESFVLFVRRCTLQRLVPHLRQTDPSTGTPTTSSIDRTSTDAGGELGLLASSSSWVRAQVAGLMALKVKDVEEAVWHGKEALKSDRTVTCTVPYRLAVNIILKCLPPSLRRLAVSQLKAEEDMLNTRSGNGHGHAAASAPSSQDGATNEESAMILVSWVEGDIYGDRDAMRIGSPRTPVFELLGHSGCGKTTLLRALQPLQSAHDDVDDASSSLPTEALEWASVASLPPHDASVSTPCLPRCAGTGHRDGDSSSFGGVVLTPPPAETTLERSSIAYPTALTIIDTPGHRLFAELRLHTLIAVDVVVLVINLAEGGVQPQTREAIVLALNADRPIVVVFNKLDLFSDEGSGGRALQAATQELKQLGLDVSLVSSVAHLSDVLGLRSATTGTADHGGDGAADTSTGNRWKPFICRQGEIDPNFAGSLRDPVLALKRRALGVCVAASQRWNIEVLRHILTTMAQLHPPRAVASDSNRSRSRPCAVQAVVLEATKQAHQQRKNLTSGRRSQQHQRRDRYEASVAKRRLRNARQLSKRRGSPNAITQVLQEQTYYTYGRGGQSGSQGNPFLFITVLVKCGVLVPGTPFVADQSVGVVEEMLDEHGHRVLEATPGMIVTVVDKHSQCGAPGGGVHLLSLPSSKEAYRVFQHRLLLHRFVSVFPDKTDLLRPRGMDVRHRHLGIYYVPSDGERGSSRLDHGPPREMITKHLGMQLLYGAPQAASEGGGGGGDRRDSRGPSATLTSSVPNSSDTSAESFFDSASRNAAQLLHNEQEVQQSGMTSATPSETSVGKYLQEQATIASNLEEAHDIAMDEALHHHHRTEKHPMSLAELNSAWLALQPTDQELQLRFSSAASQSQLIHVGVMIKADSWHGARILQREVQRLGCTRRVQMQVVVARFGRMTKSDFMAVSSAVKVVLCYRTPPSEDEQLDRYLEMNNVRFGECSTLSAALRFLKECAVDIDREAAAAATASAHNSSGNAIPMSSEGIAERRRRQHNVVVLDNEPLTSDGDAADDHQSSSSAPLPDGCDEYLGSILQQGTGLSASIDTASRNRRQKLARGGTKQATRRLRR